MQRRLESQGDEGVTHRLRGKVSNNAADKARMRRVLSLCRKGYAGLGPTLASEKLAEDHRLPISRESLRKLLIREGLWQRQRQRDRHRARRERRPCFGEMVQADASEHDWLEG